MGEIQNELNDLRGQQIRELTPAMKKAAVDHLVEHMAIWLLADIKTDKAVKERFDLLKGKLNRQLEPEQRAIIAGMRDMVQQFCILLLNCQDVDQLWNTFNYLTELEKGRVLIVQDVDMVPEGYTTNQGQTAGPLAAAD